MFERFTEKAVNVIVFAQEETRRLHHNVVDTEQILIGLIRQSSGIAGRTLASMGVTLEAARGAMEEIIATGDPDFYLAEIPFSPRSKKVLEFAWAEAEKLNHNFIGTEHILLGLVTEGGGVACAILSALNVDLAEIRPHMIALLEKSHADKKTPTGWTHSGTAKDDYEVGLDSNEKHSGSRSAYLKSIVKAPRPFGLLSNWFSPEDYFEKRIQMTAWAKSAIEVGSAELWLRIDGGRKGNSVNPECLRLDERPLTGFTDWQKYELVTDIPKTSTAIVFGLMLVGKGQVWLDDFSFEEVSKDVALTGRCLAEPTPSPPKNLNFEEEQM